MKRIINLIFIFIIMMGFIPNVYALNNVEIENVSLVEKSNDVLELSKPSINNLDIGFDLSFVNVGDYAKYKVIIKNNSGKDYYFNQENKFNNSDYISYTYEFLEKTNKIKANSSIVMYITLKYSNKVPEDKLNNYIYTEDNNMSINLSDILLTNPSTYTNYLIVFIILLLVLGYIVYDIKTKKKIGVNIVLLILLLIPIGIHALENITIRVSTKVLIEESRNMIESRDSAFADYGGDFWQYNSYIKTVTFETKIVEPSEYYEMFDVSDKKNNSIIAYLVENSEDDYFDLYIMSNGYIYANYDSSYFFDEFENLTRINKIENFKTVYAEDMSYMFSSITKIEELDLSSFDTSNVTNMKSMFGQKMYDSYNIIYDTVLKSINISNFDTSNVTDMSNMFEGCSELKNIDLSSFDTNNVTDMSYMFYCCNSLTNLDLSSFDTSSVDDMCYMFYRCGSLTSLDLSNFDTSNVSDMSFMFYSCGSLTSLDLSNFDTSNVDDMHYMFSYCDLLTSLDLSNFDTSNVDDMHYMFSYCDLLTSLDLSSFHTHNVTNMRGMFYACDNLENIYVGYGWNVSNVSNSREMFFMCFKLPNFVSIVYDKTNANTSSTGYLTLKS